jgi:hypothetical protein
MTPDNNHKLIISLVSDVLDALAYVEAPLKIADPLEEAILAYDSDPSDENLETMQKAALKAQEWLANTSSQY